MKNYEMAFSLRDVYPDYQSSLATHEMTIPDMVERNIYPASSNGDAGQVKTPNDVNTRTNHGMFLVGLVVFIILFNFIK